MKLKKWFTLIEMLTVIFIIWITTAAFLRLNNLWKDYSDYERQIASSIYQEIDSELKDFKRNKIILSWEDNWEVYEQENIQIIMDANNLNLINRYYNRENKEVNNTIEIEKFTDENTIVESGKIKTRKDIKKWENMEITFNERSYSWEAILTKDWYFMILNSIDELIQIDEEMNSNNCRWISVPRKPRRKTLICDNNTYTQSNNKIQEKQPNQIPFIIKINDKKIWKITIDASTLTVKLEYCCKDQNNCRANEIICNW